MGWGESRKALGCIREHSVYLDMRFVPSAALGPSDNTKVTIGRLSQSDPDAENEKTESEQKQKKWWTADILNQDWTVQTKNSTVLKQCRDVLFDRKSSLA